MKSSYICTPVTGGRAYARRLARMYYLLRDRQNKGADFSSMKSFLEELSALTATRAEPQEVLKRA